MEHIAIDDLDVAVEVVGGGPALVLLHGILQDSRAWRQQLDDLGNEFTVVAWDAPGCGQSSDPPETWRFPEYADCLAKLIRALEVGRPVLVGVSWGGTLALELAYRHPDVAKALILAGAYAGWAGSLPLSVRDERLASCLAQSVMAAQDFVPEWMPGLLSPAAPPALVEEFMQVMSDFHPSGFRTMAHAVAEADLRAILPTIEIPALLLYGDDDRRAPARTVGADLAMAIPQARLHVIMGSGHLCNAEQPNAFNAAIREFLETHC